MSVATTVSPGTTLRRLREAKPLVHQITNYVVMNETANATLALGALPVMAHAKEEVEEMAALAGALVINIGTLSPHWVEAMLAAGKAANAREIPIVVDPVGAGATGYRTETSKRLLEELDVTVLRGNFGEVATLVGVEAEVRGVESMGEGDPAGLARAAARSLGVVASVTGAIDHVSDDDRLLTVANGHELLAAVSGTGCMSSAITGCFLAGKPSAPLEAAAEALAAFGVAAEDAASHAQGPGTFHAALYDALAALDPDTLDERAQISER
jgi:hydroxyethylthiazole kinase